MNFKALTLTTLLFASFAAAQSAPATQSQTFDFKNNPGQQGLQEIATVLRTVGDIRQLSIDSASTITIQGTTDELAMSGWIIRQLDQPVTDPPSATASPLQYPVAGKSDDVIRVFHVANLPKTPQVIQELLTTLRTVANDQKAYTYTALQDLIVRGPAAQIALSAYLINALDVAPGSVTTAPEFQDQPVGAPSQVTRVFYLTTTKAPQQIQEILTVLRTVVDVQKIFNSTANNALAIRASAGDMATAAWIIQSLDILPAAKPAPSAGPREFIMPVPPNGIGNSVRVFYLAHINTPKGIQETLTMLRTKLSIQKVFNYSTLPALVVRGTADQITKAEQMINAQDQLAMTTP